MSEANEALVLAMLDAAEDGDKELVEAIGALSQDELAELTGGERHVKSFQYTNTDGSTYFGDVDEAPGSDRGALLNLVMGKVLGLGDGRTVRVVEKRADDHIKPGDSVPVQQRGTTRLEYKIVASVEPWGPNPAKVQVTFTDGTKLVMQGPQKSKSKADDFVAYLKAHVDDIEQLAEGGHHEPLVDWLTEAAAKYGMDAHQANWANTTAVSAVRQAERGTFDQGFPWFLTSARSLGNFHKRLPASAECKRLKGVALPDVAHDQDRVVTYVLSTATEDRDGETVNPEGGDFSEYTANPTVSFNHDTDSWPVGRMLKWWNDEVGEGTKYDIGGPKRMGLLGDVYFSQEDEGDKALRMVKEGTLNGGSISFLPQGPAAKNQGGGNHYDRWKLLEFSVCPVGSNPDAVALKVAKSFKAWSGWRPLLSKFQRDLGFQVLNGTVQSNASYKVDLMPVPDATEQDAIEDWFKQSGITSVKFSSSEMILTKSFKSKAGSLTWKRRGDSFFAEGGGHQFEIRSTTVNYKKSNALYVDGVLKEKGGSVPDCKDQAEMYVSGYKKHIGKAAGDWESVKQAIVRAAGLQPNQADEQPILGGAKQLGTVYFVDVPDAGGTAAKIAALGTVGGWQVEAGTQGPDEVWAHATRGAKGIAKGPYGSGSYLTTTKFEVGEKVVATHNILGPDLNSWWVRSGEPLWLTQVHEGIPEKARNRAGVEQHVSSMDVRKPRKPKAIDYRKEADGWNAYNSEGRHLDGPYRDEYTLRHAVEVNCEHSRTTGDHERCKMKISRKVWVNGKSAWLLKSEGGLDEETKDYLEERGLDDVRIEDKGPNEGEGWEQELPPGPAAVTQNKDLDSQLDNDEPQPTALDQAVKAARLLKDAGAGEIEAVEEAVDGLDEPEEVKESLKRLVWKRVRSKRFVLKRGGGFVTKEGAFVEEPVEMSEDEAMEMEEQGLGKAVESKGNPSGNAWPPPGYGDIETGWFPGESEVRTNWQGKVSEEKLLKLLKDLDGQLGNDEPQPTELKGLDSQTGNDEPQPVQLSAGERRTKDAMEDCTKRYLKDMGEDEADPEAVQLAYAKCCQKALRRGVTLKTCLKVYKSIRRKAAGSFELDSGPAEPAGLASLKRTIKAMEDDMAGMHEAEQGHVMEAYKACLKILGKTKRKAYPDDEAVEKEPDLEEVEPGVTEESKSKKLTMGAQRTVSMAAMRLKLSAAKATKLYNKVEALVDDGLGVSQAIDQALKEMGLTKPLGMNRSKSDPLEPIEEAADFLDEAASKSPARLRAGMSHHARKLKSIVSKVGSDHYYAGRKDGKTWSTMLSDGTVEQEFGPTPEDKKKAEELARQLNRVEGRGTDRYRQRSKDLNSQANNDESQPVELSGEDETDVVEASKFMKDAGDASDADPIVSAGLKHHAKQLEDMTEPEEKDMAPDEEEAVEMAMKSLRNGFDGFAATAYRATGQRI